MELGNMIFGHSRGNYEVPRSAGFEEPMQRLFDAIEGKPASGYGQSFENEVFSVFPYYWGDCDCEEIHKNDCLCIKPNFLFKPTGFELRWYKYPMRDSYMSEKLSANQFSRIINKCIASLRGAQ